MRIRIIVVVLWCVSRILFVHFILIPFSGTISSNFQTAYGVVQIEGDWKVQAFPKYLQIDSRTKYHVGKATSRVSCQGEFNFNTKR